MSAGASQAMQAVDGMLRAVHMEKQAARRSRAGCLGEQAVCSALSSLSLDGVLHLDDRRLPADARSRANIDHLVIGPTGVFVVDAKNWAGRIEVRGGSVLQDGVYRDERLTTLTFLTHRVEEVMAVSSAALVRPQPLICFARPSPGLPPAAGPILLSDLSTVADVIRRRPAVLTSEQVSELVEMLSYAFPPYVADQQAAAEAEGLLFPDSVTRHAGLAEAVSRPIEDWMVWLHPEQASAVRRIFGGPARIRGAAGTGKTCVGLHRLAWLASTRPGRFLVTSYVNTLPQILATAYQRLAPRTAERVDFRTVHKVAGDLLAERGVRLNRDSGKAAFSRAWKRAGAPFADSGLSREYLKEEVDCVIKGRGLTDLASYLAVERAGRRTPLRFELRRAVWELALAYDEELAHRGQHDFTDVLRLARDAVRTEPCTTWTGVMVDEVQDIPLVGLQLLHELAGRDRPDGLLLIGDGQQALYPGGFRLSDADISLSGRAVVLRTNYRNTVEIVATARNVVRADEDDFEAPPDDPTVEVARHGALPLEVTSASVEDHDRALVWDLMQLVDAGAPWNDIAVLCSTNDLVGEYAAMLTAAGIPAVALTSKRAAASGAVSVATWHRSKGLEYAHVFIPQLNRRTMLLTGGGEAAEAEKEAQLRRALYVAMTRARDTLWLGRVDSGLVLT
jgi:hypothetical protein